jgi:hypothetical protein
MLIIHKSEKIGGLEMTEGPIPPEALMQIAQQMAQLTEATRAQITATLASSIITASGRPHSIQQAMDIARDIQMAMYPAPQIGFYQEWAKTKAERLNKIHGAT